MSEWCPRCHKKSIVLVKRNQNKGLKFYKCKHCGYEFVRRYSCLKLVTVHLPEFYIKGLEELVKRGRYPNKSEAIRVAVRDLLANELWNREEVC